MFTMMLHTLEILWPWTPSVLYTKHRVLLGVCICTISSTVSLSHELFSKIFKHESAEKPHATHVCWCIPRSLQGWHWTWNPRSSMVCFSLLSWPNNNTSYSIWNYPGCTVLWSDWNLHSVSDSNASTLQINVNKNECLPYFNSTSYSNRLLLNNYCYYATHGQDRRHKPSWVITCS